MIWAFCSNSKLPTKMRAKRVPAKFKKTLRRRPDARQNSSKTCREATQEFSQTRQCLVRTVKPIRPEGTMESCQRDGKLSTVPLGRRMLAGALPDTGVSGYYPQSLRNDQRPLGSVTRPAPACLAEEFHYSSSPWKFREPLIRRRAC
jgi:hypothetical protein